VADAEKHDDGRGGPTRWKPGTSGNPSGRARGSTNKATRQARELLNGSGDEIMLKAIELAKAGEPVALRLCIDRLMPRRALPVELELPEIRKASDVAEACQAVVAAAASGQITLADAREFMALLEVQRRAIETEDLAFRIEVLENAPKGAAKHGLGLVPSSPGSGPGKVKK
jgi:hypothetical protein